MLPSLPVFGFLPAPAPLIRDVIQAGLSNSPAFSRAGGVVKKRRSMGPPSGRREFSAARTAARSPTNRTASCGLGVASSVRERPHDRLDLPDALVASKRRIRATLGHCTNAAEADLPRPPRRLRWGKLPNSERPNRGRAWLNYPSDVPQPKGPVTPAAPPNHPPWLQNLSIHRDCGGFDSAATHVHEHAQVMDALLSVQKAEPTGRSPIGLAEEVSPTPRSGLPGQHRGRRALSVQRLVQRRNRKRADLLGFSGQVRVQLGPSLADVITCAQ